MFKPYARITTQVGYSITSVGGQTPQFNFCKRTAHSKYYYHQPLANLSVDIGHNLTARMGWNYY